jgi:hypothetical protein
VKAVQVLESDNADTDPPVTSALAGCRCLDSIDLGALPSAVFQQRDRWMGERNSKVLRT